MLALELRRLRSTGPSAFATLTAADESYVQVGGGGAGCIVERRDAAGRHYRAAQVEAVVPFDDGTTINFAGKSIPLKEEEWFLIGQVVDVFDAFRVGAPFPAYVVWRDITDMFT